MWAGPGLVCQPGLCYLFVNFLLENLLMEQPFLLQVITCAQHADILLFCFFRALSVLKLKICNVQASNEFWIQSAVNFSVWVKINDIYLKSDLESWPSLSPIWLKECTSKQIGIYSHHRAVFLDAVVIVHMGVEGGGHTNGTCDRVMWEPYSHSLHECTKQNKLDMIIT